MKISTQSGHYEIIAPPGEGGMGEVTVQVTLNWFEELKTLLPLQ
jgi:hypothetical protein